MRRRDLTRAVLPGLLALALLGTVSCDDDEPEEREGRRLSLTASPSLVSLLVDPSGTSTVEATLTDLDDMALVGETIKFSATPDPPGSVSPLSGPTDMDGKVSTTFTSDSATVATVTATNPTTSLASLVVIRVVMPGTHTLSSTDPVLTSCTDTVTLSGELKDSDGNAISGASVTFDIDPSSAFGGMFTPTTATTNSAGTYGVTFTPTEEECTSAMCDGMPTECQIIVKATSLDLETDPDLTITESF